MRARVQQFDLPLVKLRAQVFAQIQITVHHHVDHAQHQIGGAGWQATACCCSSRVGLFTDQSIFQVTFNKCFRCVATFWVNADEQFVELHKTNGAGVNAMKHSRIVFVCFVFGLF